MFISTEHSSNNTVVPVGDTSWLHTWLQLQLHHATLGWLHSTYFQQPQTVLRPTSSSIRLQSRSSPLHVIESRYSLARAETRTSQMSHISGKERERNWRREGCDEQLAATIAVRHCCTRRRAQTLWHVWADLEGYADIVVLPCTKPDWKWVVSVVYAILRVEVREKIF